MAEIISSVKERILQLLEYKGIAKENFFEKIGVSYGNFKGKSKISSPSTDVIEKISANIPDVNLAWLITGKGKMTSSDYDIYINSSLEVANIVEKYGDNNFKFNVFDFSSAAAAGDAILLNEIDKTKAQPNIFLPALGPGINIRIPVKGDSMYSTIKDGDRVVATLLHNPKDDIRSGYVYVIMDKEDGIIIKRIYKDGANSVEIVSDNEIYKPYKRKLSEFQAVFLVKEVHSSDLRNYYDDVRKDVRELQIAVKELQHKLNG